MGEEEDGVEGCVELGATLKILISKKREKEGRRRVSEGKRGERTSVDEYSQ